MSTSIKEKTLPPKDKLTPSQLDKKHTMEVEAIVLAAIKMWN